MHHCLRQELIEILDDRISHDAAYIPAKVLQFHMRLEKTQISHDTPYNAERVATCESSFLLANLWMPCLI